jgi:acyl-CoA thioester hydrolase
MADGRLTRSFTLTVRYAETDAQGVVHHANYLTWFEEGRSEFLRQQGCSYSDMERNGFFVIVVKAEVEFRAPSLYEDRITIATTLVKGRGRMLEFSYRATNQDGVLVATGLTCHVVLDAKRHMVSLPDRYLRLLSDESLEKSH